jgi:hypothetical protein
MSEIEEILVRCDGAPVPSVGGPWHREVVLTARGPKPSVNLKIEGLKHKVIGAIHPRVDDLIRIAAFVYAADLEISRGGLADVHLVRWKRNVTLCIPVNDVVFWAKHEVRTALIDALMFATEDWWSFHFTQDGPNQLTLDMDSTLAAATPDCVVLFSGGTDSLCATLQAVLDQGRKPLLVSHRSAGHHAHRHLRLIDELDRRIDAWGFPQISFWVQNQSGGDGHETQRSRAFLYAALGAAVAGQARVPDVLLADNGYVSLNPPINGQVVGAVASRGTHPTFLRLVNTLLTQVFAGAVTVRNPLDDQTRAETLTVLTRHNLGALLPLTRSCGKSLREKGHPHCGACSQCVDRRIAVLHAGLANWDLATGYRADCFTSPIPAGRERTLIRSYAEFALTCDRLGPEELFIEIPELSGAIDGLQPGASAEAERIARLLARHSAEVLAVMAEQIVTHRDELVRGEIDAESLLGAWPGFPWRQPAARTDELMRDPETDRGTRQIVAAPRTDAAGRQREQEPTLLRPHQAQPHANEHVHVLQRVGKTWLIAFGDEKGDVADSIGWRRLLRLLQYPGQPVSALDLVAASNPPSRTSKQRKATESDDEHDGVLEPEVPTRERVHDGIHVEDILDPPMIEELQQRVQDLPFELKEARDAGDQRTWLALKREYEACQAELRQHVGIHNKSRRFSLEVEHARSTVSKTVRALIASFALTMPHLHQHLDRFVRLGYKCVYDPHPLEHWQIAS